MREAGRWLVLTMALAGVGAQAELVVSDAWVRALPPTQRVTAGYLEVRNSGPQAVRITGARAPLAGRVEMHRTREVEGMARMEPVAEVTLSAGESASFAPGGLHLMLLDLERMPADGESTRLCLVLASGSETCAEAAVRRGGGQDHHSHH